MNKAIEVGNFLLWVNDIECVHASEDANGYYIRIELKSGTGLRVDAQSYQGMNKLKSKIYDAMIEARNTKDGDEE